jgi:hypothetical protein
MRYLINWWRYRGAFCCNRGYVDYIGIFNLFLYYNLRVFHECLILGLNLGKREGLVWLVCLGGNRMFGGFWLDFDRFVLFSHLGVQRRWMNFGGRKSTRLQMNQLIWIPVNHLQNWVIQSFVIIGPIFSIFYPILL